MRGIITSAAALLALSPLAAEAKIYALSVGINQYDVPSDLEGAVNDANDIAAALTAFGAAEVTVLLDSQADRAAIEGAWRRLVAQAAADIAAAEAVGRSDERPVVVFTYAGHGGHESDLSGDEVTERSPTDTQDEILILGGYSAHTPQGMCERIVDDELSEWFHEALSQGVRVVFVADSCYSGGATRGHGRRSRQATGAREDMQDVADCGRSYAVNPPQLDGPYPNEAELFFFSAVEQSAPVDEVLIEGEVRGALSYGFAHALRGAGDKNDDGVLTRDELLEKVLETAYTHDDDMRQEFEPRGGNDRAVLEKAVVTHSEAPPSALPIAPGEESVGLRVIGQELSDFPQGAHPAEEDAELTYDSEHGDLQDFEGALVAKRLPAHRLQAVVDKQRILRVIRRMAGEESFNVGVRPETQPREYRLGQIVELSLGPADRPYLLVFNLANDGAVQPLYPANAQELGPHPQGATAIFPARAKDPIGADHLIAIASDRDLTDLRFAVERGAGTAEVLAILRGLADQPGLSAALLPLFTTER